jgi:RecB family exonuclease
VKDRLLPDILPLSASAIETWRRCPREYLDANVLGLPASDEGRPPDYGTLVHAMLEQVHVHGSCHDEQHVEEVLALHGIDADNAVATAVSRHASRCPSPAEAEWHEVEAVRFHKTPPPQFIVTGRLDAVWQYDDVLEIRDYKTGSVTSERVADDPRARLQAWLAAPRAQRLGLRLRVRYEHLAPEIADDPESFAPDDEDLAAIGEELRAVATAIREAAVAGAFPGVADPDVCRTCRYRSICPASAAPGVPTWPTPPDLDPAEPL